MSITVTAAAAIATDTAAGATVHTACYRYCHYTAAVVTA